MEKVVYIIGAGFSAPLGLPVMANFLERSKDIYFNHNADNRYAHFKSVFDNIEDLSYGKNYYEMNLFNIEEILSILDMKNFLSDNNISNSFTKYIEDVIQFYTPPIKKDPSQFPSNWDEFIFGDSKLINQYGLFISHLFNVIFEEFKPIDHSIPGKRLKFDFDSNPKYNYSIISLNYDLVFENVVEFLKMIYPNNPDFTFNKGDINTDIKNVLLAKLHGSVDIHEIVPPTWSKMINNKLNITWKSAYEALATANHIIILGYSLPETDSYIRYLLKAAVTSSKNLKSIDVLCLDNHIQSVKKTYDNFIIYPNYRFVNANIQQYLEHIFIKRRRTKNNNQNLMVNCNNLYDLHQSFIATSNA